MNHLKLAVMLLLTASTTFASDRLSYEGKLNKKRLVLSDKGHVGYTHNPYPSMYTANASRIKAIANKTLREFPINIPTEFPVLLKVLGKVSLTTENNTALEDVKNYIKSYLPSTAIKLCGSIPAPFNEQEQVSAIQKLHQSLQVLSNVKPTLTAANDEYNRAVQAVYDTIIKFTDAEYFRLHKLSPFELSVITQYDQIIKFFDGINLSLFDIEKSEKVKCYHVTMLLGGANIAGMLRDNHKQLDLAQQAEKLTESITSNISHAYLDDSPFIRNTVRHACLKIISKAELFLKRRIHQQNVR